MKILIEWLGEYVDLSGTSDEKLSDALTMTGTENEIVKDSASFNNIVVGEIKEITKHPNADKLQVTKTDVGRENGGILQIVCGAPNIEVGQKVPVALVGAEIGEFEIKETEIRGVMSHGMLCSESELGISDDHTGIMILDARAKVGANLSEALNIGGTVLEAEITPNRGDCLSMIGIANEAAAALGRKVGGTKFKTSQIKSNKKVQVEVKEKELCPRYIAKVVDGVKIGPSPKWMCERLSAAGVRPINNIVDVTNYVMLELGQPLHAFDFDEISSVKIPNTKYQIPKIIVRKAKAGEILRTLDGVERKLTTSDLVIADNRKAIALAGVMGGENSEVSDKTNIVILEAAVFNRVSVRKTAQRLTLRSEASNRFEKGIPLTLPEIAIERAAQLLVETLQAPQKGETLLSKKGLSLSGPKVGERVDVLSGIIYPKFVGMRTSRLSEFMGIKIPEEIAVSILTSLGFGVEKFDFKKEARSQVGKPYVYGAKYTTHQDLAFDCSYLTDFIYRKIGKFIGHTALAQYEIGEPVEFSDLLPGDILFYEGHATGKEILDHYFTCDENGEHKKVNVKNPKLVGHCGIYIGGGRVVHARQYEFNSKTNSWKKLAKGGVIEEDAVVFTKNPGYLGARRFTSDPDDWLSISVPWWRLDISIEEDIFEEVGRIYGYDKLPSTLPSGELPVFEENQKKELTSEVKNILSGAGFSEVINYSLVSGKQLTSCGGDPKKAIAIANPINPEQEYLRTSLAPSLLSDAVTNQDNFDQFKIFEIAPVYLSSGKELPNEVSMLGIVVRSAKKQNTAAFYEAKGALELLVGKINLGKLEFRPEKIGYLTQGQTASIYIEGKRVGYVGMANDKIRHDYGIKSPVAVCEIEISALLNFYGKIVEYQPISKFPTAVRDMNFTFDEKISVAKIEENLKKINLDALMESKVIDVFPGDKLDTKKITIRFIFGSNEKTLDNEEIMKGLKTIRSFIEKAGGMLTIRVDQE